MPFKSKAQRRKFAELLMKAELQAQGQVQGERFEIQGQIEAPIQARQPEPLTVTDAGRGSPRQGCRRPPNHPVAQPQ